MPVGNPKPQTVATKKYEKKAGFVSKSYKLKRTLVDQFADACEPVSYTHLTLPTICSV